MEKHTSVLQLLLEGHSDALDRILSVQHLVLAPLLELFAVPLVWNVVLVEEFLVVELCCEEFAGPADFHPIINLLQV